MPDEYTMGDLARQDIYPDETLMQPPPEIPASSGEEYAGLGGDPRALATGIKNWWTNQPSWMQKVGDVTARDTAAYQSGGAPAVIGQLADTSAEQDLLGGFGGNTKSVTGKVVPGALAALGDYHPPFYSAVEQAVAGAKQTTAPGQQWAGFLRNQPGVKPEELSTLKLGDLFDQTGAVTKQDLLDHIAANKVNVGEVVKGEGPKFEFGTPEEQSAATQRFQTARQAINNMPANEIGTHEWNVASAELGAAEAAMRDVVPGWGRAPDSTVSPTKFSQYTLPGGENYREMLLTLPTQDAEKSARMTALEEKLRNAGDYDTPEVDAMRAEYKQLADETRASGTFKSSHFDEPNILAHIRTNDRVIDGKKTLFVEEVQSDWHQKGKREGYANPEERQALVDKINSGEPLTAEEEARRVSLMKGSSVPDAPFKTTWPDLAMKRVIRQAAEGGYDKVAWTPGSVQADRYDLSKQISALKVQRLATREGDLYEVFATPKNGDQIRLGAKTRDELPDIVGKEMAQRITDNAEHHQTYTGLDLKVGGEGMKGFYDQILPAAVNKIVKKAGGRVEQAQLGGTIPQFSMEGHGPWVVRDQNGTMLRDFNNRELAEAYLKQRQADVVKQTTPTVHSVTITPQLREMALKKGFPLFTAGGLVAGGAMGDLAKQDDYQ